MSAIYDERIEVERIVTERNNLHAHLVGAMATVLAKRNEKPRDMTLVAEALGDAADRVVEAVLG